MKLLKISEDTYIPIHSILYIKIFERTEIIKEKKYSEHFTARKHQYFYYVTSIDMSKECHAVYKAKTLEEAQDYIKSILN